jgi:hypothetical protein
MRRGILQLPSTSSWYGAELSTGTTLPYLTLPLSLLMLLEMLINNRNVTAQDRST